MIRRHMEQAGLGRVDSFELITLEGETLMVYPLAVPLILTLVSL